MGNLKVDDRLDTLRPASDCSSASPFMEDPQTYTVEDVYAKMSNTPASWPLFNNRATLAICFVISLFGETLAPFAVLAPIFQTQVPEMACNEGNCSDVCGLLGTAKEDQGSWTWVNKHRTIVSEFDLQCKDFYRSLASAVFFLPGMAVGLLLAGFLSDKLGRKKTNISLMLVSAIFALAISFSGTFQQYLCFQAFLGVSFGGTVVARVVWMLEFVQDSHRPYASATSAQFYCLGTALVPLADYLLQDWRYLHYIIAGYALLSSLAMMSIPESPHWLLANQRTEQLQKTFQRMVDFNGQQINVEELRMTVVPAHRESGNLCLMFRDARTLLLLGAVTFLWVQTSFLYYSFYHMVGQLNGSVHWNIAIMALLEGPCLLLAGVATTRFGRRPTLLVLFVIVITTSLGSLFNISFSGQWDLRRVLSLLGSKAGSGPMWFVVYILTIEVLPTSVRSTGMCTCSMAARFGAAAPAFLLPLTQRVHPNLHYLLYIALCVLGFGVTWMLNETKGQGLSETIKEVGKKRPVHRSGSSEGSEFHKIEIYNNV